VLCAWRLPSWLQPVFCLPAVFFFFFKLYSVAVYWSVMIFCWVLTREDEEELQWSGG
jgi:hypothetical protein